MFFKHDRNGEHNFWHTATYQKAGGLLKDAYINMVNDVSANDRQDEADALIDYVRGNSPISFGKTSSRRQL